MFLLHSEIHLQHFSDRCRGIRRPHKYYMRFISLVHQPGIISSYDSMCQNQKNMSHSSTTGSVSVGHIQTPYILRTKLQLFAYVSYKGGVNLSNKPTQPSDTYVEQLGWETHCQIDRYVIQMHTGKILAYVNQNSRD